MTIKIKPAKDQIALWDIFENGQQIGTVWFCRDRRDVCGRITVKTSGWISLNDGRKLDLGNYAWWADVRRDIDYLITLAK